MCVVVEYDATKLTEQGVIDLLLESSGGLYGINGRTFLLSPSPDKHKNALFKINAFTDWMLQKCVERKDIPYHIADYLHAMVDEWYHRGDPK